MSCCQTKRKDSKATVTFGPSVTIEDAGELRETLLELIEEHETVELATSAVEKLDISFLQILHALCTSLDRAGKELRLSGEELCPRIREAAAAAGLFRYVRQKDRQPNALLLHRQVYGEESEQ